MDQVVVVWFLGLVDDEVDKDLVRCGCVHFPLPLASVAEDDVLHIPLFLHDQSDWAPSERVVTVRVLAGLKVRQQIEIHDTQLQILTLMRFNPPRTAG